MKRVLSLLPILVILFAVVLVNPGRAAVAATADEAGEEDAHLLRVQAPSECSYVHGIEQDSGTLYRVDLRTGLGRRSAPASLATPPGDVAVLAPDGLAYDPRFRRLYFAAADESGSYLLHSYDLDTDTFGRAGGLFGAVTGATFHDGGYYYVDAGTTDLRRVFLDEDGNVFGEASVADFGLDGGLAVEDLAARDGILYGSTSGVEDGPSARFFSYDLARDAFRTLSTSSGTYLQLAFAHDRGLLTLFGASTLDGVFYEIDHLPWGQGSTSPRFTESGVLFSDLAAGAPC